MELTAPQGREAFRNGKTLQVHYNDGEWHSRLLLRETTPPVMKAFTGEDLMSPSSCVWWVATPTGDVFPEELGPVRGQLEYRWILIDGTRRRREGRAVGGFAAGFDADPSFDFAAGTNLADVFVQANELVGQAEPLPLVHAPTGASPVYKEFPASRLCPVGDSHVWRVASSGRGPEIGSVLSPLGLDAVVEQDVALAMVPYTDGRAGAVCVALERVEAAATPRKRTPLPLRTPPEPTHLDGRAPPGPGAALQKLGEHHDLGKTDEEDLRVLPVQWRGDRRFRSYTDAIELMVHYAFADPELEGDWTFEWYLQKIQQTGQGPVARSRSWQVDNGIPAGGRFVYEHHVIAKVIQTAVERGQLNLPCLESFELLARRAQVIEAAHAYNPSNPDYGHAEDMMGWGIQRGGALVMPGLSRLAATKASERTSVLKEKRRFAEDMRLSKGRGKDKGQDKGQAGKGKGGGAAGAADA